MCQPCPEESHLAEDTETERRRHPHHLHFQRCCLHLSCGRLWGADERVHRWPPGRGRGPRHRRGRPAAGTFRHDWQLRAPASTIKSPPFSPTQPCPEIVKTIIQCLPTMECFKDIFSLQLFVLCLVYSSFFFPAHVIILWPAGLWFSSLWMLNNIICMFMPFKERKRVRCRGQYHETVKNSWMMLIVENDGLHFREKSYLYVEYTKGKVS